MSVVVTHATLGACLLMSPDQCQTLAGSVPFVSSIAVLGLVNDASLVDNASLTSMPCFYHAGLVCWSLAASRP
jgi:hypothetical protein